MEDLVNSITAEKLKSSALRAQIYEEKMLRIKAEESLDRLRKFHETLALKTEMEEEFLVKNVRLHVYI